MFPALVQHIMVFFPTCPGEGLQILSELLSPPPSSPPRPPPPQPRAADSSGHCRTATASSRSHCATQPDARENVSIYARKYVRIYTYIYIYTYNMYTYISNIYFQMTCQKLYQNRSEKCVRVGITRRKFVFLELCFLSVLSLSSVDADYLPPCCFLISSYTIRRKARYRPLLHSLKSPWKGSMTWPTATRTRAVSKP